MKSSTKTNNENAKIEILHDTFLIDKKILVISDLHIGYEEQMNSNGLFPRVQLKEITHKLDKIFWDLSMRGIFIKKIIINGDLKHEFGIISDAEWRDTLKFLDYLEERVKEEESKEKIVLVRGNHDTILGPIAKKRDLKIVDYYTYKDICFLHGDKTYTNCFKNFKRIVLGHLHPAIVLSDKYKKEKYKCFLRGKWKILRKTREVFILPSFSPMSFGYDLSEIDEKHSPDFLIIKPSLLKKFDVIIYEDKEKKEYNFGKLKKLI